MHALSSRGYLWREIIFGGLAKLNIIWQVLHHSIHSMLFINPLQT